MGGLPPPLDLIAPTRGQATLPDLEVSRVQLNSLE
jgi:hypothetical protein